MTTPAAPPPPAERPARAGLPKPVLVGLAVVGAVALFVGSAALVYTLNGGGSAGHEIRFEITSTATDPATVNWSGNADSEILTNEPLPWSKTVSLRDGIVGVTASAPAGVLTCRLLVDGRQVDRNQADLVVNCSATVSR
ncbi:hypothetical protein AB0M43_15565 [Longispora sp. NPDC051575]|uniref:hypothetical protein n=1 Tax=Longispora sp. NPDC051575 TaxID=3154943 RepID=UPI00342B7EDF